MRTYLTYIVIYTIISFVFSILFLDCNAQSKNNPPATPIGYSIISYDYGVTLYKKNNEDTYIQMIELNKGAKLKFLLGRKNSMFNPIYPPTGIFGGENPLIIKQSIEDFSNQFNSKYGSKSFSVTNGSFFECELRDLFGNAGTIFGIDKAGDLGGFICENLPLIVNFDIVTKMTFPIKIDGLAIGGDKANPFGYDLKSFEISDDGASCEIKAFCGKTSLNTNYNIESANYPNNLIVGYSINQGAKSEGHTVIATKGKETILLLTSNSNTIDDVKKILITDFAATDYVVLDGGGSSKLIAKFQDSYEPFVLCPQDSHGDKSSTLNTALTTLNCGRLIPQAIGILSGPGYQLELASPVNITPENITQCSIISITAKIKNIVPTNWKGKIYFSLHKMNDDFITDLLVASNIYIPSGESTILSSTIPLNTIDQIAGGNIYKVYVKYQEQNTVNQNDYPFVGAASWVNPTILAVNYSANCEKAEIPFGNYKKIEMYGLSINPNTNDLEFMFRGHPAKQDDPVINIKQECDILKKIFKTALVTPSAKQWISIDPLPEYKIKSWGNVVKPVAPLPFRNSEMANRMFMADLYLKEFWDANFRVSAMNKWKSLIMQSPYWNSIRQKGFNNYAFYPGRACIIPGTVSVNSKSNSIQINQALLSVESENYHTPYILPWNMDLILLSQQERNELNNRLQTFDSWITGTFVNREAPFKNLLNNHTVFSNIRQIYTSIALAQQYKKWNFPNKPMTSLFNSENMTGISEPMIPDQTIVDLWNQSSSLVSEFNQTIIYSDFDENTIHFTHGGCVMSNINSNDLGALNGIQIARDTTVFKNRSWIKQDSTTYFYGGTIDHPIADLLGTINIKKTKPILGDTVQVNATIFNFGNKNAQQFPVRLYEEYTNLQNQIQHILIGQLVIANLDSFSLHILTFNWTPLSHGNKKLKLTIDEGDNIIEKKEDNNIAYDSLCVLNDVPVVHITFPVPGSVVARYHVNLTGKGYDNRDGYLASNNLSWTSDIDGFLGNGNYINVDSLSVGNHVITLTGTNTINKTAFDFINLYVFSQGYPAIFINSPANNETLPDNINVLLAGGAYDLDEGSLCRIATWTSDIEGLLGTGCAISQQLSSGNHTLTFSVQNASGNTISATRQVTIVRGSPQISIVSPVASSNYDQHESVSLIANATDFPQGNISAQINWYSDLQGYLGIGQNIPITLIPGIHTITASVQDNAGSVATATVNKVTISYTPPVPVILQPQNGQSYIYKATIKLIGNAADIQDGSLHGNNLKWFSSINGFIGFGDTLHANALSYGTHIISLKATDSDNIDSTVSVTNIFIDAGQPTVTITAPANGSDFFCGNNITFIGNSTDPQDGQIPSGSLSWYSDADGYLGSGSSIVTNELSAGYQTITLEATDSDGFIGSTSIGIFIEPPHPPSVSIYYPANNSTFINGSAVTLKAFANDNEVGVLPDYRISWTSSVNGNLGTGKTVTTTNLSPGNHTIIATAIDTTGLTATAKIQIVIEQQKPIAKIISPSLYDVFSLGTEIALTGSATDFEDGVLSGNSLQWFSNVNGNLGSGNSINTNSLNTGSHFIHLIATDSEGANDTATIVLIIQAPHTELLTKFAGNADSIIATFGTNGGDTTFFVNLPASAVVTNAQVTLYGMPDIPPPPQLIWSKDIGDVTDLALNKTNGDIYATGGFSGNRNFGGINLQSYVSSRDIFVARYKNNGTLVWAKQLGGAYQPESGEAICVDNSGNCYVAGYFRWSWIFPPDTLDALNSYDGFVVKYDSLGNILWKKQISSAPQNTLGEDAAFGIALDNQNNVYISGKGGGNGSLSFDGVTYSVVNNPFIIKTDSAGNLLWIKSGSSGMWDVCIDKLGNFIGAGGCGGWSCISKSDFNGNLLWTKNFTTNSMPSAYSFSVTTDESNNIYATGRFAEVSISMDGHTIYNQGHYDAFLLKLTPNGSVAYLKGLGGSEWEEGNSIAIGTNNELYWTGAFNSNVITIDTFTIVKQYQTNSNASFIMKLDSSGNMKWTHTPQSASSLQFGNSIACDGNSNLYAAGKFRDKVFFNNGSGNTGTFAKFSQKDQSYPYNLIIDVGNDNVNDFNFLEQFSSTINTTNLALSFNTYLQNQLGTGIVNVPIRVHSDSSGILKLKHLNIQYLTTDTIKPSIISARTVPNSLAFNSSFSVRVKVIDNEKVQGVTANFNNINYTLNEVSLDSFQVSINANTVGMLPVLVTVSDTNGLSSDTTLFVKVYSPTRDLEITDNKITVQPAVLFINDNVHLTAVVKNNSNLSISNAQVALIIDGVRKETKIVSIGALFQSSVNFSWIAEWGQSNIEIKADPNNLFAEANENNNSGFKQIVINDPFPPIILQATATPNSAYINEQVLFRVKAVDSTGIASVTVNWLGQNVTFQYNVSTEFYEGLLIANTVGTSDAVITVHDQNNLKSIAQLSVQVINNLPDLKIYSSEIQFIPSVAAEGESVSIQVKVRNTGNINVNNTDVSLSANGVFIGNTSVSVLADSFSVVTFNWIAECGNKTFTAIADSAKLIAEANESNNSATKGYRFCSGTLYQLTVLANPEILTLGNNVNIEAVATPNTTNAVVYALWNRQSQNMPYDNNDNAYQASITPAQTGTFIVPVTYTGSGNNIVNGFTQFTVTDNLPELSINKITTNIPAQPYTNTAFSITVSNNSLIPVSNPLIHLLVNDQVVDSVLLGSLNDLDTAVVNLNWTSQSGTHLVTAIIDPHYQIIENNKTNNSKSIQLNIQDNQPPVIHYIITNSPTYQGSTVTIESYVTDNDSMVSVSADFQGNTFAMIYDTVSMTWKAALNTPVNGTFNIGITATDKSSLTSYASTSIVVNDNLPDLEVKEQDIVFTHIDSVTNTIAAVIGNNGGSNVTNAKIHFLINGLLIDSAAINIVAGGLDTVSFTFNYPVGYFTATITADQYNTIVESNEINNSAIRNIFIPDLVPPETPVVIVNSSTWSAKPDFYVSWNQVFDNSGTITYEYSVNGSVWINTGSNLSTSVTVNTEGLNYAYVRAKDAFGNLSQPGIGEMKYDNTPPNTPLIAEYHCGTSWTTHDTPYFEWLSPGDIGSGIQYFEISIDNIIENIGLKFSHHPTLSTGKHTIKLRAIDYVGNAGNWSSSITVYIDLDNPQCPEMQSTTHPNQSLWYQNDSIALHWNRPIETSSVTGYFFILNHEADFYADQTSYWIGKDSLTINTIPSMDTSKIRLTDGIWYIHMTSQDSVGHFSSQSCSYKVMIDKTPPFIIPNYMDTVLGCTYTFNLHSEDYTSGVANTFYRINNKNWQNDTIVRLNITGLNLIEFYATDLAGNNGAVDSIHILLKNNPPKFAITPSKTISICQNDSASFILNSSSKLSYLWSNGTNGNKVVLTQAGKYLVTATDANKCVATDSVLLSINKLPIPSVIGLASLCKGASEVTYFTESFKSNYIWTVSSGGIITSGSFSNLINVAWDAVGTQSVTLNYIDEKGCTGSTATVKNITVFPLPVPTLTGLTFICEGITGVTYSTDADMSDYTWTVSSGGIITSGLLTNSIKVNWNKAGNQSVSVNYTNKNGCTGLSATTKNILVNPLPIPFITGLTSVCKGTKGVAYTTNDSMIDYVWNVSQGGIITSGLATHSILVNWNNAGDQSVSVNYTNKNGCNAVTVSDLNVKVNPLPIPIIKGFTSVCEGITGVSYTTENLMSDYVWTISNGGIITNRNINNAITVTWNIAGVQSVSVNYSDLNGCTAPTPILKNVIVNSLPIPTIEKPADSWVGTSYAYSTEADMTSYNWNISSGGIITTGSETNTAIVKWLNIGWQSLGVNYIDKNGCTATIGASQKIKVIDPPLSKTGGFSPNDDGLNDLLIFGGLENYPRSKLVVFTKEGQIVYESEDYQNNWDGRFLIHGSNNRVLVATGVYYFVLKLGGTSRTIKGSIYIDY